MKLTIIGPRVIVWLVPIIVLGWVVSKNIVPSGIATLHYEQGQTKNYLSGFENSLQYGPVFHEQGKKWRAPLGPSASMYFQPWKGFREIQASLALKNPTSRIFADLAYLPSLEPKRLTLFLPELEAYRDWTSIESDGYVLLQREAQYSSIRDFLASPPESKTYSAYNVNVGDFSPTANSFGEREVPVDQWFRGTVTLRVYLPEADQALRFTVKKHDLNKLAGPDRMSVLVYDNQGVRVHAQTIDDDGSSDVDGLTKGDQVLSVVLNSLTSGEYTITLAANDEVISTVSLNQQNVVVLAPVRPYATPESPTEIILPGQVRMIRNLGGDTQVVQDKGETINLASNGYYEAFVDRTEGTVELSSPNLEILSDLGIRPQGFHDYRNSSALPLLPRSEADRLGVQYILAHYQMPKPLEGQSYAVRATLQTKDFIRFREGYLFTPITFASPSLPAVGSVDLRLVDDPLRFSEVIRIITSRLRSSLSY